ncbi:TPA: hypothetical protein JG951_003139 [Enterobacter hormaechei subsp. steigerwaltii]|nr:hypothetical protein [Enterobacter hormaechei subsp. steigerwaltii]
MADKRIESPNPSSQKIVLRDELWMAHASFSAPKTNRSFRTNISGLVIVTEKNDESKSD